MAPTKTLRAVNTALEHVLVIVPEVSLEPGGRRRCTWHQDCLTEAVGYPVRFVQEVCCQYAQGVLRGLYYQVGRPAGTLVRAISGRAYVVAVDLRSWSHTVGQWAGFELTSEECSQLWVPAGFAHGVLVVSPEADLAFESTEYAVPANERCLAWDDPSIGVQWPLRSAGIDAPILSVRERAAGGWADVERYQRWPVGEAGAPSLEDVLTPRERQILGLVGSAMTNKEIAQALGVGESTVKTHLSRVYAKLNQRGRFKAYLADALQVLATRCPAKPGRTAASPTGRLTGHPLAHAQAAAEAARVRPDLPAYVVSGSDHERSARI